MAIQLEYNIRVRYSECDPQRMAHHSAFVPWIEEARTEMLRVAGMSYRECEENGIYFTVAKVSFRYRRPVRYDDVLRIVVTLSEVGKVKLEHTYQIFRDEKTDAGVNSVLVTEAASTLVCLDGNGNMQVIPDSLVAGHQKLDNGL